MAGSEDETGTMPSGVDCREPLREPLRYEAVRAGLERAGMVMARPKLGEGEGMRGREMASCSSDMVVDVEQARGWIGAG